MEKRTIWVKPSCFTPEIEMIIPIPEDRDAEEYQDGPRHGNSGSG